MSGLSFISDADFRKHIELTILQYGGKLKPYDLRKFNSNLVDPIKLIFDKTVYVEMKNKHNTMNASSRGKTYIKMQGQLLSDDDCACFLVEAIAKRSQNVAWAVSVDGTKQKHKRSRTMDLAIGRKAICLLYSL
jgi:hypothetical protein